MGGSESKSKGRVRNRKRGEMIESKPRESSRGSAYELGFIFRLGEEGQREQCSPEAGVQILSSVPIELLRFPLHRTDLGTSTVLYVATLVIVSEEVRSL